MLALALAMNRYKVAGLTGKAHYRSLCLQLRERWEMYSGFGDDPGPF